MGSALPYDDFAVRHAIEEVRSSYNGVRVRPKWKTLNKFGRNEAVGTGGTTLMTLKSGQNAETYASGNTIGYVSSSSSADMGKTVVLEYHVTDGAGNLTFGAQTMTLDATDGQVKTAIPTACFRVSRSCTYDATGQEVSLTGDLYVYEDDTVSAGVPATAAKVHLIQPAGRQQSQKAATSISSVDYWVVTRVGSTIAEKTTTGADIRVWTRRLGQPFRAVVDESYINTGGPYALEESPYCFIIPANSDVYMQGVSASGTIKMAGRMSGFLLTSQGVSQS